MVTPEFRWLYEIKKDYLELYEINNLVKNIRLVIAEQGTKNEVKLVSFSELSSIENAEIIFMKLDEMQHKLNKILSAFNFRPNEIEFNGVIYKAENDNIAKKVMDRKFINSSPVTLLTTADSSHLKKVKDKFDKIISMKIGNDYAEDKEIWSVIDHLSKDDFKEYYVAYEVICRGIGILDGKFLELSEYSGIAKEQIESFYITANALHRHKKGGKKPPGTPMDYTTAKILILRLFTAWLERLYST